jgi:hypothetical protein
MKRIALTVIAILMVTSLFAAKKVPTPVLLTPEQAAEKLFAAMGNVTDTAKAMEADEKCIAAYKKLIDSGATDRMFYYYVIAVDNKNSDLVKDKDQQKQAFKDAIALVDKYCEGNTNCANSIYISYCYMTLWGRYGELIDTMEAATSGIAGKIKDNAEKIYAIDKTFKNYVASKVLGRLHFKAPNIIFIMTWPDKNLSKKYLEEYMAANPGSNTGKFYLADTLWDLGEKDRATALYKEVMAAAPAVTNYFEDLSLKETVAARMKEQGIQ